MRPEPEGIPFDRTIACSLKDLYGCDGVDGFNDLIESKLGHGIEDADWKTTGIDNDGFVLIRVWGMVAGEME